MSGTHSLKNHFLIALPDLQDPNFFQTVTYICEHDEQGSMGIVINRPTNLTLGDIASQLALPIPTSKHANLPVHAGGPVQQGQGFLLHYPPTRWEATLPVSEDIAITFSRDLLQAVLQDEGPDELFIALGYAGWAPGQLERELQEDSWLFGPASREILFHTPIEERWQAAAQLAGVDLSLITRTSGHA